MEKTSIIHKFPIGGKIYIVEGYTTIYSRTIKNLQVDADGNVTYGCTSNLNIPEPDIDSGNSNKYSTFNRNWMKAFSSEELAFKAIVKSGEKWVADVMKYNHKFALWYINQ